MKNRRSIWSKGPLNETQGPAASKGNTYHQSSSQTQRRTPVNSLRSSTISIRLLPYVITALSLAILKYNAYALTPQEIYRQAEHQVWVLEVLNEKGAVTSSHTALLIDKGKVVTQCDLLQGATSLRLVQGSEVYQAKPEQKDIARNLCLLSVPRLEFTSIGEFEQRDPEVGAQVYAISNSLGLGISISEGIVSGLREYKGESVIQFTAAISPGSEGGGLYNAGGRLVGFITYRPRDGQNVNFALPARWLSEIEKRAASTDAAEMWRAKAITLSRELKWEALAQHVSGWTGALPDSVEAWLWLGFAEEQKKGWPAAEHAYREALKHEPSAVEAGLGLARTLLQQGKPQEALESTYAVLPYRKEDVRLWLAIAYSELRLSHPDRAKQAFERAAQLAPWNREAYIGLANMARSRADWSMAVAAQRHVVQIDPTDAVAWIQLAETYIHENRPERALSSADRAIELAPSNGDAWLFKGIALQLLKRDKEAIEVLKKGLTSQPLHPAVGWSHLGDTYYNLKLYPEAIAAYQEAVRLEPGGAIPKNQLGIALKDGGHFEEALTLFEKLKTEHPDDPFAWRQIGFVHSYLAQPDAAIQAYERALSLDPKQPHVWQALLEAYHTAGRRDDVKRAYRKLSDLDPTRAEQAYKGFILPYEDAP